MINIFNFIKTVFRKISNSTQIVNDQFNSSGFNIEDKPKNFEQIRTHFEKLKLNSYFDLEILQDENEFQLDKIEKGIVAGFAVWSGYSYIMSNRILNEIIDLNKTKIRLIIIDVDYFSIKMQKKLFGTAMYGYFECCLVVKGEIVKIHKYSCDIDPFIFAVKKQI